MTTVPGHNIVIQQAGTVNEAKPSSNTAHPSPGQAVGEQAAAELARRTTVQESEESEALKSDRERYQASLRGRRKEKRRRRKKREEEQKELSDSDESGNLLDTVA